MKTSARFLAMLLAVVMIASAALSVSAFSDVTAGVEHATAISVLSQLGVIGGYADGTFKPDQAVTRAEMAKLVYVLYTTFVDAGTGSVKFDDVKADNWAAGYISWCYNKAIIGGYGNGKFGPADNVTYDQALKMVCGTLGYNEWDSALWPVDVRTKALRDLDLGAGIPATVKGTDNLTRGQVAQIMYNALFANMAEKKMEQITLGGNKFFSEVPKVLAEDVWNFEEVTYEVMATLDDSLKLQNKAVDENDALVDSTIYTIKLEKLGLEEYEDKTADLIGLYITALVKDPEGKAETLPSATIKGSVVDGVVVNYDTTKKFVSIDGVKYYADDFASDAKNQIKLVNADNTTTGLPAVFGADEKLTTAFANKIQPNQSYFARTIDYNGDGKLDAFVVVPQVAYKVDSVKTLNKVLTVNYTELDGTNATGTGSTPAANVSVELKKGDVFVGAKMGQTLYATIVEPVETYATKLSTGDKKVTLAEGGVVKYDDRTVDGVAAVSLSTATLGEDNKYVYYIYNGEILMTDASGAITDYNFAILVDVIKDEGELDKATMTKGTTYKAVLLTGADLKETEVVLSAEENSTINGVEYTAAQLYDAYNATDDLAEGATVVYNYTIVAAYEEDDDGAYSLTINKDLDTGDDNNYEVIGAGAYLKYNAKSDIYTLTLGGQSTSMIFLDDNSKIYYRYDKPNTASGAFMYLGAYDKTSITKKSFGEDNDVVTYGETYLAKHDDGTYTLLATIVTDEIVGSADDGVKKYTNDGRLVLYAPESSSTEFVEKKLYNSYVFMDNATFENKSTGVDKTVEADDANDTEAGKLYGWNPATEVYDEVTAGVTDTAYAAVIKGVSTDRNLVKISDEEDGYFKVDDSVTIWGLAKANKLDEYTQLTLAELKEMFDLVDEYNTEKTEELEADENPDTNWTDLEIRIIVLQAEDTETTDVDYFTTSIIVELYEADEEGDVAVVNGTIHDNFGTLTQA